MKLMVPMVSLVWVALVGASFGWNYVGADRERRKIGLQTARSFFSQVIVSRAWNAAHGGVYVPVSDGTPPNPYLEDPLREIKVNDTLTLTKVNPAYMTRQAGEIAAQRDGIRFHITSLQPIRPANRATPREELALGQFENGVKEVSEVLQDGGRESYFYMAPLNTDASCLKCHAKQGYREGQIRGGISVTIPFVSRIPFASLALGHVAIGSCGLLGIVLFGTRLNRAYNEIKRQSVIDALTGIPNRRCFMERVLAEFSRSRRDQYPLSILMGDIDNFKAYNDTYGHQAGDECLRQVAAAFRAALRRPADFCARYGGEEFVVILPQTGREGAQIVAESIRAKVEELRIAHRRHQPEGIVTISLGAASAEAGIAASHEELIHQADEALYRAKAAGRNRVVHSLDRGEPAADL